MALLVGLVAGCEDDPPMEKPQPPPHLAKKKAEAKKVSPADATESAGPESDAGTESGTESASADGTDGTDEPPTVSNGTVPNGQTGPDDSWPGAPPSDDDPLLKTRPKSIVPPMGAQCGLGTAELEQSVSFQKDAGPPSIRIVTPEPGKTLMSTRLRLRVSLKNFKTWRDDKAGSQHVRVVLDNEPGRPWYDPAENAFAIDGLAPGWHTLRVYLVRPWGEVVRSPEAFDAINFFVRTRRGSPQPADLTQPFLTYASPHGEFSGRESQRILLDFHAANVVLKPGGHRVRVTLDALPPFEVTSWAPTWLEAVPPGKHTLKMELLTPGGTAVGGPFQLIVHEFEVKR